MAELVQEELVPIERVVPADRFLLTDQLVPPDRRGPQEVLLDVNGHAPVVEERARRVLDVDLQLRELAADAEHPPREPEEPVGEVELVAELEEHTAALVPPRVVQAAVVLPGVHVREVLADLELGREHAGEFAKALERRMETKLVADHGDSLRGFDELFHAVERVRERLLDEQVT